MNIKSVSYTSLLRYATDRKKWPFIKRSTHEDLNNELDVALVRIEKMETIIKYVDEVCNDWQMKKVGNLRAISSIAKLFNLRTAEEDK